MEAVKDDSKENVVIALLEVSPIDSDGRPESLRRGSKPVEENAPLASCSDANCYGRESDKDMEKALEQQAQLIGKYEEMEKAQREWEERFKENNGSTPVCSSKPMHLEPILKSYHTFFAILIEKILCQFSSLC